MISKGIELDSWYARYVNSLRYNEVKDEGEKKRLIVELRRCSQQGIIEAYYSLGSYKSKGKDKRKIKKLLTKAAKAGLAEAQYELYLLYKSENSADPEQNKMKNAYLEKAVSQGYEPAVLEKNKMIIQKEDLVRKTDPSNIAKTFDRTFKPIPPPVDFFPPLRTPGYIPK